ncbi:hypothetical protein Syun_018149 [Stephania yunnanensis]|uniref:Uncharacterized protein n=1 Tax=Stephania yunnanensis TaxID=152371 RepID=A0AAP0NUR2_9MAGN
MASNRRETEKLYQNLTAHIAGTSKTDGSISEFINVKSVDEIDKFSPMKGILNLKEREKMNQILSMMVINHYSKPCPSCKIAISRISGCNRMEIEIEKLRLEHIKLVQENDGLHLEKQKLAEEASYAKMDRKRVASSFKSNAK